MEINILTIEKINAEHPLTDKQLETAKKVSAIKDFTDIALVYKDTMRNECAKASAHYGTEVFSTIYDAFKAICDEFERKEITLQAFQLAYTRAWTKLQEEIKSRREVYYSENDRDFLAHLIKQDLKRK